MRLRYAASTVACAGLAVLAGCSQPILRAAMAGDTAQVEAQLALGASLETKTAGGCGVYPSYAKHGAAGSETPLICAAIGGHLETVRVLLDRGADPRARDFTGRDALFYADAYGFKDVSALLRSRAAAPSPAAAPPPAPAPVAASDVDRPGFSLPEDPDKYALVIGVERYESLPPADFAERDAAAVRAHLLALGYPPRNIAYLTGAQGSFTNIKKYAESWLPNRVNERSTVFVYFSGHGAPDLKTNEAYLVPYSGDPEYLQDTAYPLGRLYRKLDALKAEHVLVALDSCFSGAGGRSVLAKGVRPLVVKVDAGPASEGKVVALSASDANQISGSIPEQSHGAFTYYLLKGLDGAAEDGAKGVTVKSLYDYLAPKVADAARLGNRDQTPRLFSPTADSAASFRLR